MTVFARLVLAFLLPLLFLVQTLPGQTCATQMSADDSLFTVEILHDGQSLTIANPDDPDDPLTLTGQRELSEGELAAVQQGLGWWSQVLGPDAANSEQLPIVLFGSLESMNAGASPMILGDESGKTFLAAALADNVWPDADLPLAYIYIGVAGWYTGPLTMLPENGADFHLTATIVHELVHALGMSADIPAAEEESGVFFSEPLGLWTAGLRDAFDNPAHAGMEIVLDGNPDPDKFVLDGDSFFSGAYFIGEHVLDVISDAVETNGGLAFPEDGFSSYDGVVPGLPVNGSEGGIPELSHVELQNSLLSHQNWRNWATLMEAEYALLQDLGLSLDRKRFFGSSIYASGTADERRDVVNTRPFYARENGQWITGKPSTTPFGIGLHVYGSYNNITQQADLLTIGEQAVAMRIEGVGNHVTIAEGSRLQADGSGGSAILVSYGKEHVITLDGKATALGDGGIAARFDFGDNMLGNTCEYRGSWMRTTGEDYDVQETLSQTKGALVSDFVVSGTLKGRAAAIYIAENAHVQNITILSGAVLEGDIISQWDPDNEKILDEYKEDPDIDLSTSLTFGKTRDEDGELVDDEDFDLVYTGNIDGAASLVMTHAAGSLTLTGAVNVFSLTNSGTLSLLRPDPEQVTVAESFTNAAGATLETGFTADGSMAGITASSASLSDSTWAVRPLPDFYGSGQEITLALPVTTEGDLVTDNLATTLAATDSPTLSFTLAGSGDDGPPSVTVTADRAGDAYSQYADSATGHSVGQVLGRLAPHARGDMRHLLAALDWSAPDGSDITSGMKQLSSTAYDISARAALSQQNEFNLLILRRMLATRSARAAALARPQLLADDSAADSAAGTRSLRDTDWQLWATPYGASSFQQSHGGTSSWKSMGIGLLVGADRHFDSGLDLGLHVALAARRTQVEDATEARVDTKSAFAGAQAMFSPAAWDDFYLTAQGRLGIESGEMDREVHISGYHRQLESNWTGFAGSALLGFGKDFTRNTDSGFTTAGPLAFFEYAFLQRPAFSEDGDSAASLSMDQAFYDSLLMNLGAHAGWQATLASGTRLGLDILAAWRHELLDGDFSSTASFKGYGAYDFDSETELPGRDSLLVQAALNLTTVSEFSARLEVGAELLRTGYSSGTLGLTLSWSF